MKYERIYCMCVWDKGRGGRVKSPRQSLSWGGESLLSSLHIKEAREPMCITADLHTLVPLWMLLNCIHVSNWEAISYPLVSKAFLVFFAPSLPRHPFHFSPFLSFCSLRAFFSTTVTCHHSEQNLNRPRQASSFSVQFTAGQLQVY